MIGKGKTKKRYLYLFFAIILIIFIVKAGFNAIAAQNKPQLNISVSTDRSKYLVNAVSYTHLFMHKIHKGGLM